MLRRNPSRTAAGRRKRSRGQSLVEFALVFPIFMLVLAGILDFGFLLYNRMSVINAAREGARAGSIQSDNTAIRNSATSAACAASPGGSCNAGAATVTITCIPIVSAGSCDFNSPTGYKSGDEVKVRIDYPYHSFFASFFGSTIQVTSAIQMVIE